MQPLRIIKASIFTLLTVAALQSAAQLVPGGHYDQDGLGQLNNSGRIASVMINKNLIHGESLQVRKLLNGLNHGDYVEFLNIEALALQPGAYLQVIVDQQVIGTLPLSKRLSVVSLPLNLANGVDYKRLLVRSIGKAYVKTLSAQIEDDSIEPIPELPDQPPYNPPHNPPYNPPHNPPHNPPPYNPPHNPNYGSLSGYCSDYDHTQFRAAKDFAYNTSGLNYGSDQATNWALSYNQSHACGTVQEYTSRFSALKNMAYNTMGLNKSTEGAVRYALDRVEFITADVTRQMQNTLTSIRNFTYNTAYLNLSAEASISIGEQWLDRRCEDPYAIQQIQSQYTKEYNFAYSMSGLNYSSQRAKEYALNQIRHMSRCSDLFR